MGRKANRLTKCMTLCEIPQQNVPPRDAYCGDFESGTLINEYLFVCFC